MCQLGVTKYGCPQLSLLIITSVLETNKMGPKSYSIIPCSCIQAIACFEHSNFFKVNVVNPTHTQQRAHAVFAKKSRPVSNTPCGGPTGPLRNPKSFLTEKRWEPERITKGLSVCHSTDLSLDQPENVLLLIYRHVCPALYQWRTCQWRTFWVRHVTFSA